jgi:predicted nucleic acid-binding protein
MRYVVDASVVVKWLVEEPGSEHAKQVMAQPVLAPDLVIAEVVNVLRRKFEEGKLTVEQAARAAALLENASISFEPTQPLAGDVLDLSLRLRHYSLDCAYLAVAMKQEALLISADEQFVTRCRRAGFADRVLLLDELPPMVKERPMRPYKPRRLLSERIRHNPAA